MFWTGQWNFFLENIPLKIISEVSLPWKSQQWKLHNKETPILKISLVKIALQQIKKTTIIKIENNENKG